MDEITRKRLAKPGLSTEWTPEECLESALDDVRLGKEKPNKVIILLIEEGDDTLVMSPYFCNTRTSESIGYLELAKAMRIDKWRGK